ncbi:hypothetical protein BV898_06863 [Hypsibius exemplaris]|uniref:Uncharacterized protein n=1 Tax=Hypsibius exemplaris TaxID=2072580 RepID=A0A1W0WUY2_HYPEX|nr:hypothetical protein BV898_06863 [Hypsibius exemplaris]
MTQIFFAVPGYANRVNDLLVAGSPQSTEAVVFFGGDIQDLEVVMGAHREAATFSRWSLEKTTRLLEGQFANHLIVAVRPSRRQDIVLSCFDNFVKSTDAVSPSEHAPNQHALEHLDLLLESLSGLLGEVDFHRHLSCVKIVGFSKGCVVLNQLVYEFPTWLAQNSAVSAPSILRKIGRMYWLDAGHSGPVEYWITQPRLLDSLRELNVGVHVVISPYQVGNLRRPSYVPQLEEFLRICGQLGVLKDVTKLHEGKAFADATIDDHFDTLLHLP